MGCIDALEERLRTTGQFRLQVVWAEAGPLWYDDGFPVEWSEDHYKRWTARVSRPARKVAPRRPTPRLDRRTDLLRVAAQRAISTVLHSTLAMTKDGMNLQMLGSYAGHDVSDPAALLRACDPPLPRHRPIDLETECEGAKQAKARPFAG